MKKSEAFPLPSPYFRSIWFENKVSWCALKSSFERKWLVNVCCKNDDEMRWILLSLPGLETKNIWDNYVFIWSGLPFLWHLRILQKRDAVPFIRDVITITLKLLVILCPGGKLIKWNDMKILTWWWLDVQFQMTWRKQTLDFIQFPILGNF